MVRLSEKLVTLMTEVVRLLREQPWLLWWFLT